MVAGQDTPDIFSTNVFEPPFKIAAACFRRIDLSKEFDTERLSKDARLMIIIGLLCSAVTNNYGLSFFQLTWFQKPLAASIFPIIATLRNGNMTTFKNNSFLNNVYVWIQACYEIFLVDSMYGSYRSAHVFETLLPPCYHL